MKLHADIEKALNKQLNAELESAYIYLALAAYFDAENLEGFAGWMKKQANEEVGHAMRFYSYITDRNGRVELDALPKPSAAVRSPKAAFQLAYEHEQKITQRIQNLNTLSGSRTDQATQAFLIWFVNEQVEEEDQTRKIVDTLAMIGDSPEGLLLLDRELGKRE